MAKGGRVTVEKSRRGISRWKGDDKDEEDEEYIAEEEELESESCDESLASSSDSEADGLKFGGSSKEFSGSDGSFEEGSDYEFDDSEFEEEEEIQVKSSRKRRKKIMKKQTKNRRKLSDSEEDDEDDEDFDIKPVLSQNRRKQSQKRESEGSDYEEEEDEDLDEDEDFTPDVEDEEYISISNRKNGYRKDKSSRSPVKRARKNRKSRVSRRKQPTVTRNKKETKSRNKRRGRKRNSPKESATKQRRRLAQIKDDDFIVDDDDVFDFEEQFEPKKKNNKRKPVSDSDTSEFEFVTSDEDDCEDDFVIQEQIKPKKRRKCNVYCSGSGSGSGSGSDSSDSDYVIHEEEVVVKDMRKRKREDIKGKEKEEENREDSGKKVCGICLSEEQRRTTRGVLDCCAHFFCFACIVEWSKVESRCPVCKRRFETITKASSSDSDDLGFGAPRKVIKVPKRDQVYQPSEEDIRGMLDPYENVLCMECQQGGNDNLMLLCDICDSSAHTYCVGLGNSVPEGNWYCDCCRSAGAGPSNLQTETQPQPSVGPTDPAATEFDPFVNIPPTPSSSSAFEIDLNASPRDVFEEAGTQVLGGPSQVPSPSAGGAATLSSRRAIRNRIRILLSNTRPMQVVRRNGEEANTISNGVGFGLRTGRSVGQQGSILAPHRERGGARDADRAKEQVQTMVKNHLKQLCSDAPLERDAIKEVARRAIYTVLAACGFRVEHRNLVSNSISAPTGCSHDDLEWTSLLPGSCSACFDSFVRDVAASILNRG